MTSSITKVSPMGQLYPPPQPKLVQNVLSVLVDGETATGGEPLLSRALTPAESTTLADRKRILDGWLASGRPNEMRIQITAMLSGFGHAALGDDPEMTSAQYAFVCRDLPEWAVERACHKYSTGTVTPAEIGQREPINWSFPPSTAILHRLARSIVEPTEVERAKVAKILRGRTAKLPALDKEERAAFVEKYIAPAIRRRGIGGEALEEARAARAQEALDRVKAAEAENRRSEYYDAGVEPPEPKGGLTPSLPLLLKMGWTIEQGPGGRNRLVGPGRR